MTTSTGDGNNNLTLRGEEDFYAGSSDRIAGVNIDA